MSDDGNILSYFARQNRKLYWQNVAFYAAVIAGCVLVVLWVIYWPA